MTRSTAEQFADWLEHHYGDHDSTPPAVQALASVPTGPGEGNHFDPITFAGLTLEVDPSYGTLADTIAARISAVVEVPEGTRLQYEDGTQFTDEDMASGVRVTLDGRTLVKVGDLVGFSRSALEATDQPDYVLQTIRHRAHRLVTDALDAWLAQAWDRPDIAPKWVARG